MIDKKHISITVLIILLIISSLSAQIGIKGGPALSDIVFANKGQTPYLSYEINSLTHRFPYLTYQFGIFTNYAIGKRFELQPELLFVKKGLNYSKNYIYDDITYIIKICYLEIPILLKYSFTKSKRSAIIIGPYFSYMIDNKRIREFDGELIKDEMNNVDKFDFGIATGLSFDIGERFIIDTRFTYSLVEMMDYLDGVKLDYYGPEDERARNVNLSLTLGYNLPLVNTK